MSTGPGSQFSRKKTVLFTAVAVIITATIGFLALETWVRLTKVDKDLWAATGRHLGESPMKEWAQVDAFAAYRGRPGHIVHLAGKRISSQGFISTPDLEPDKPEGTIRIAFLGGSSTAGTGITLKDTETWPWQAAELLREKTGLVNIEFINAAQSGYTTFESFGLLWSRLRFYSPDIVVVSHAWNEMYYFNHGRDIRSWRRLKDGSWGFHRTRGDWATREPLWIDHLLRPSQLLTRVRLVLTRPDQSERSASKRDVVDSYNTDALEWYRTNLRLLRDAAPALGVKMYAVRQPTLIVEGLPQEERDRCNYHVHGFNHDAHVDAFDRIYKIIDDEIDPEYVVDLTHLSGIPENFEDHVHPTPLGAQRIAEAVADRLAPVVERRADAPAGN